MIPLDMLKAANREPGLRGRIDKTGTGYKPIMIDGCIVGFYRPHRAKNGVLRVGPIYVAPEYRGRGIATGVYAGIREPLMAAVRDDMTASTRMHERAGFVRWKRFQWGWYWRRDAL